MAKTKGEITRSMPTPYMRWQEQEGIPSIGGYAIEDLFNVPVSPWPRLGAKGVFINLEGSEQANDAYVCEIPPGGAIEPQRHLFEAFIFVLKGRGATSLWQPGGRKQSFEWGEGSLFAPPLNCHYQLFNGSGAEPARFLAMTTAPVIMNLFHNPDFVFKNDFVFRDRYNGEQDFFDAEGTVHFKRLWESNFIPDVYTMKLLEYKERGAGVNIRFQMSDNTMGAHISEFPIGTYKKGHRHGPGAHVIILNGAGYSLMWPQGTEPQQFPWKKGSLLVPPDNWFHQHFNAGPQPARYLALRWGSDKYGIRAVRVSHNADAQYANQEEGGDQIDYAEEDPAIMKRFQKELAQNGLKPTMPVESWRK
jgi:oxalate decarboxylase/phosphoglucose isomerase-like protein (cupin superfamily)/quercetin dioxygenase-like cupin family protein